jgi:ribosomal-protein-alanine N-acetyltransferase
MKIELKKLTELPLVDLGDVFLRAIEYRDYKDMFEYGSDKRVTKTLSWSYEKLEDAESSIKSVHLSRPERNLPLAYAIIHKDSEKMIGTCDFHTINWDTSIGEIGYVINYDYWGRGYMTKTCKALIEFGFKHLELSKVVISHNVNNTGSQRVIEKSGFNFLEERIHQKNQTLNRFYEIDSIEWKNIELDNKKT